MWNKRNMRAAGVTLVELVVAIVIVAVALAGMVAVFMRADRASVDPVVTQQMAMIAEGMMEEILLKPYSDANPRPAKRTDFAKVADYDGYASSGVYDIEGNAVPGLDTYDVRVVVADAGLGQVASGDSLRVTVTVHHAGAADFALSGWRTKPW